MRLGATSLLPGSHQTPLPGAAHSHSGPGSLSANGITSIRGEER